MRLSSTVPSGISVVAVALISSGSFWSSQHVYANADEILTSPDSMTQISMGEFEVILRPTPEPLTEVDIILGPAIELLARRALRDQFGEAFQYMHVASLDTIDYNNSGGGGGGGGGSNIRTRRHLQGGASTSVSFVGGVVALDEDPDMDINSLIQSAVESNLPSLLVGQGGSWTAIETAEFIDLSPPTAAPVSPPTKIITGVQAEDPTDETTESSDNLGRVLGGIFGTCFILIGALLFVRTSQGKQQWKAMASQVDQAGESAEQAAIIAPSHITPTATSQEPQDAVSDAGDQSEMAQYQPGELLDSLSVVPSVVPSVASEWTMVTNDTRVSGATTLQQQSGRATAMAWASSETFERDRLVSLQKDMLQSDWTAHPSKNRSGSAATAMTPGSPIKQLSFEQAYKEEQTQGEEFYLMPPSRTTKTRKGEIV